MAQAMTRNLRDTRRHLTHKGYEAGNEVETNTYRDEIETDFFPVRKSYSFLMNVAPCLPCSPACRFSLFSQCSQTRGFQQS